MDSLVGSTEQVKYGKLNDILVELTHTESIRQS